MSDNPKPFHQTTPRCTFCSSGAAALIDAPDGCTCSDRRYQYRCVQHMMRASDTEERYSIITTFPDYALLMRL